MAVRTFQLTIIINDT